MAKATRKSIGDEYGVAGVHIGIGKVQERLNNNGEAVTSMDTAMQIFRSLGNKTSMEATATHMAAMVTDITMKMTEMGGLLPGCTCGDNGKALLDALNENVKYMKPQLSGRLESRYTIWPG